MVRVRSGVAILDRLRYVSGLAALHGCEVDLAVEIDKVEFVPTPRGGRLSVAPCMPLWTLYLVCRNGAMATFHLGREGEVLVCLDRIERLLHREGDLRTFRLPLPRSIEALLAEFRLEDVPWRGYPASS